MAEAFELAARASVMLRMHSPASIRAMVPSQRVFRKSGNRFCD